MASVAEMFDASIQTGWFYGLWALAIAAGVYTAWRLRLRKLRSHFSLVAGERSRMARELHDTLLQCLVGIALQFDDLEAKLVESPSAQEQCRRVRTQVERYIRETRQSIWDLRSPTLETRSLSAALRACGESIGAGQNVGVEFVVFGQERDLGRDKKEQLLRIGQEAMLNAVRHSQATHLRTEVHYEEDSVTLRVVDDGRGFDLDDPEQKLMNHWGLVGMQERARLIGAQFRVISGPGRGTEVEAVTPT